MTTSITSLILLTPLMTDDEDNAGAVAITIKSESKEEEEIKPY